MAMGAERHLLSMFAAVARQFGVTVSLSTPEASAMDPSTGTRTAIGDGVQVTAIPGRRGGSLGSFGRGKAQVNEGDFTVLASEAAAAKVCDGTVLQVVGEDIHREVTGTDEACGGVFLVIHTRQMGRLED